MSSINRKSIELADLKENVTNYSLQNWNNLSDLVNKDPDSYLLDAKKII